MVLPYKYSAPVVPLRKPCPTERRLVARHVHQYYNNVVVAAVYNFPVSTPADTLTSLDFHGPALRKCIDSHPCLSTVLRHGDAKKEMYYRATKIDLRHHFNMIDTQAVPGQADEDALVAQLLEHIHNDRGLAFFTTNGCVPRWRLDVHMLAQKNEENRIFISFAYDHAIGDGMSGKIFHRSFLQALNNQLGAVQAPFEPVFNTTSAELLGLPHLPISASYLLAPALGHYLPVFLSKALGAKASASGSDDQTWTGSNKFFEGTERPVRTVVEILSLNNEMITAVLNACRDHDAKLTAFLNEAIAYCMSRQLPRYSKVGSPETNFISCIPTNIRKTVGVSGDTMGNIASAAYSKHKFDPSATKRNTLSIGEMFWKAASEETAAIAQSTKSIKNQPIGLLAWIGDFNDWVSKQIGQPREASWQLSNLLTFGELDVKPQSGSEAVRVERMFFCQPGDAVGLPLDFNAISVNGGDLTICISWQPGSLGLDKKASIEETERQFVKALSQDLQDLAQAVVESA